jgi:hypothetical protein
MPEWLTSGVDLAAAVVAKPNSYLVLRASASSKVRPRIAPGPLLSRVHPSLERMSISATAFRRSHGIGIGTTVVLIRWIHPTFVGTTARARPGGHAFLVFRFLGGGSAGTDISFTRRAGRGSSRRVTSPRERNCKFGSHQRLPGWE